MTRPDRAARVWRILRWTGITLLVLALVAAAGVGWYYSNEIRSGLLEVEDAPTEYETRVLRVGSETVTLEPTEEANRDGLFGLEWPGGYAQVGPITRSTPTGVTRPLVEVLQGTLTAGTSVHVDRDAFPADPRQAHGFAFRDVEYRSSLGSFPAWFLEGTRATWAIFVHGREAPRSESLRILPLLVEAGLPTLVITYRNDPAAPPSPDGYHHLGETEWQDLEAATQYAVDHGAQNLVLVGFSMGGAIVSDYLRRSAEADRVLAVILDAPALDWSAAVDQGGRNRGLPSFITWIGKVAFAIRFDIDLRDFDEVAAPDAFDVPTLLFHGTDDDTVPFEVGRRLAEARPDLVEFHPVTGAGHVESWNAGPSEYEAAVRAFLQRTAA